MLGALARPRVTYAILPIHGVYSGDLIVAARRPLVALWGLARVKSPLHGLHVLGFPPGSAAALS